MSLMGDAGALSPEAQRRGLPVAQPMSMVSGMQPGVTPEADAGLVPAPGVEGGEWGQVGVDVAIGQAGNHRGVSVADQVGKRVTQGLAPVTGGEQVGVNISENADLPGERAPGGGH